MCTKVSQQSDVESSLNSLNELLRPELTGQRKQQGQEAPKARTPSLLATPSPSKTACGLTRNCQVDGARSEPASGKEGRGSLLRKCGREGISHFALIFNHHSNPPPVN